MHACRSAASCAENQKALKADCSQPTSTPPRCRDTFISAQIVVPDTLKPFAGFGNPNIVAQRAAEREAKKAETLSKLIPTSVVRRRT